MDRDPHVQTILRQARDNARRLVEELEEHRREFADSAGKPGFAELTEGRALLERSLAASRDVIARLEQDPD